MTVSYTAKVSSARQYGTFLKLLLKWRGSIYKLIWRDLLIFLFLFFGLGILYHYILNDNQQMTFEKIAIYCETYSTLIPVSFVLGFYVSQVISRWWSQYTSIPWIDTLAIWVNSNIRGNKEKDRKLRRTLLRYACLAITQTFVLISPRVKKRFPTLAHLVEAGLLLEAEKDIILDIETRSAAGAKFQTNFIPLVWAGSLVTRARMENKLKNDGVANVILTEINKIKDSCFMLLNYDWISLPLVYTQVVTLAVYMYFLACLMGKQWVRDRSKPDYESQLNNWGLEAIIVFFPVFTILQFFFYMGWLKVAESLLNPFGDDDDDFELNWIVDRNIQVAYLVVDEMHQNQPELLKDQYWEEVVPPELPHTPASEMYKEGPPENSTAKVSVSQADEVIASSVKSPPSLHGVTVTVPLKMEDGAGGKTTSSSTTPSLSMSKHQSLARQGTIESIGGGGTTPTTRLGRMSSALKRVVSGSSVSGMGGDPNQMVGLMEIPGDKQDTIPEEADETAAGPTKHSRPTLTSVPTLPEEDDDDPLRDIRTICILGDGDKAL